MTWVTGDHYYRLDSHLIFGQADELELIDSPHCIMKEFYVMCTDCKTHGDPEVRTPSTDQQ